MKCLAQHLLASESQSDLLAKLGFGWLVGSLFYFELWFFVFVLLLFWFFSICIKAAARHS